MRYFKTKSGYVSTIGTVEGVEIRKEDFDKAMSEADGRLLAYQPEPTPEERLTIMEDAFADLCKEVFRNG